VVGPATVFTTERFTSVELGGRHACAIAVTTIAYCWGADWLGQLGDVRIAHSTTPIPVAGLTSVTSVAAGRAHSCAVAGGRAYCWGSNERGQLGAATGACATSVGRTTPCAQSPVAVTGTLTFTSVTAGLDHSCGITTAGAAYCWGGDSFGQLGRGSVGGSAGSPQLVAGGLTFSQLSAGYGFTCGVTTAGVGYCWGAGAYGQRGDGNTNVAAGSPQPVSGGVALARIAAGRRHACATAQGGAVSCWGANMYGALGNELQAAQRATPQPVAEVGLPRRE
jgi:alpha-tubulin suppressor-like RCC1 family protein